ncbi:MAG TPA: TonB-dependent receptor plug domain-containing protein, partial [Steroidobacteraceae bacterium]|nr:TonB-dependent receptor plug domain-containing protein [Steroidobacteraceae bacterium]
MNKTANKLSLVAAAVALQIAAAQLARAQTAPAVAEPGDALREIIVTARRTSENLQQTPISITALTAEDIAARGLTNVLDVANETPSLQLMPGGNYSGKSALAYIRGVGQDQFTYAFEPGVGFYVDDVYYGAVYGSIFSLADIENIQVLRGPQGTLFGKNNEGGAILLSTGEPKGDNSGSVEVGYGSYHREFVKGGFDVPLIEDHLALKVTGATNRMDGYVNRIDFACANPTLAGNLKPATSTPGCVVGTEGGVDESSLRAALKWTVNDDLSVVLRGEVFDDRSEAGAEDTLIQNAAQPGSTTADYNQYVAIPMYGIPISNPTFVTGNPYTSYSSYTNPGTGYSVPPINHELFHSVSAAVDWNTPWRVHVKDIVAYQKFHSEFANTDGSPIPTYLEDNVLDHRQFSEEFQLSGKALDDKLDWIAGAYYYTSFGVYGGHIELATTEILPPDPTGALGFPPGFPGVY